MTPYQYPLARSGGQCRTEIDAVAFIEDVSGSSAISSRPLSHTDPPKISTTPAPSTYAENGEDDVRTILFVHPPVQLSTDAAVKTTYNNFGFNLDDRFSL